MDAQAFNFGMTAAQPTRFWVQLGERQGNSHLRRDLLCALLRLAINLDGSIYMRHQHLSTPAHCL